MPNRRIPRPGEDAELAAELTWDPLSTEPHSLLHSIREQTDKNTRNREKSRDMADQPP